MELRIPEMMINFRKQFEGALISLSCNKYGSNAVQRLMEKSDEELSTQVIIDMLQSPNVSRLLLDPFGNFVFQSALNQSKVRLSPKSLYSSSHVRFQCLRPGCYSIFYDIMMVDCVF